MTTALYPGSFDPVTNGHLDIATRAAAIFDRLTVAVFDAPAKNLLFTTKERMDMATEALKGLPNVNVTSFTGLTVDFAREIGASVLVRGLRVMSDFEMELQMAMVNRQLAPGIEVVCLMSSLQYSFLSSSLIKEIAKLGGSIDNMVPEHVARALRQKFPPNSDPDFIPRHLGG
ncbi:MAG: pantetheine-phosphate adenylyltransferase [Bacteroidetes bacterium]|nr:pantetheine-phosphate adenylyltransferase [Bacteroidota bacterium]MCL5026797.1 pantetheine-phosphate adenylyltransferase [Chloroflexota bacterium]